MPEAATVALRPNVTELTVSELSAALKRTIEDGFSYVRVRGELGKVSYHSNGHVYFDLKDDAACIAGVIWRTTASRLKVKLETGLEVTATGRVTTYPGRSQYQLIVDAIEPAGLGALMALVEERKRKLAAEGLFDAARKQLLPFLPNVIGVITSPTGAVIRDILHRLADRFPRHVLVWGVRVQGEGSAAEVAAAIHGFNALPENGAVPRPDLIIVARGGGSLEDLWSFNEEIVVRAAAESLIPLISAVGHETDVTLIDFASDKRAPTPTAAAEMAVPVRSELLGRVDGLARRTVAWWLRGQETRRTELRAAARALPGADALLAIPRQRLDSAAERLLRALRANAQSHHMSYSRAAVRLTPQLLRARVVRCGEQVSAFGERARRAEANSFGRRQERLAGLSLRLAAGVRSNVQAHRVRTALERERVAALSERARRGLLGFLRYNNAKVDRAAQLLTALSYRRVLARGFTLVRDAQGRPLRSAATVAPGHRMNVEFADGRVGAIAEKVESIGPQVAIPAPLLNPVKRSRRGGGSDPGQSSLFD
jgi:exodeoxyribonuclease VII large subunit